MSLEDGTNASLPPTWSSSLEPPPYSRPQQDLPNLPSVGVTEASEVGLQLKALVSNPAPYECCCVLEDRFLLLGHATQGIQVLDMQQPGSDPKTIIWLRAREMAVVSSTRVVLMRAGRSKRVRCYSLDALLCLCYGVCALNWEERRDTSFDVPSASAWRRLAALPGKIPEEERGEQSIPLSFQSLHGQGLTLVNNGLLKPWYTCGSTVLQDYCYKLPDSRDALQIQIYRANTFVFAAVLHRDKIVLWRQRRQADALWPFYRLKVYWIPCEPRSMSFADDRVTLCYLLAIFPTEATAIGLRNSKVHTIPIDARLEQLHLSTSRRQQYEQGGRHSPVPAPHLALQWTSLIQLPFYPDTVPPTSLTTEYSNPPSYQTVVAMDPFSTADPVALPSTSAPSLFFATLGLQSFIIDPSGALFSTQVYCWTQEPNHIEFVKLENEWCAVGFGRTVVEVIHLRTAETIHHLTQGSIHFLGRWGQGKAIKGLLWSSTGAQSNPTSGSSQAHAGHGLRTESQTQVYLYVTRNA